MFSLSTDPKGLLQLREHTLCCLYGEQFAFHLLECILQSCCHLNLDGTARSILKIQLSSRFVLGSGCAEHQKVFQKMKIYLCTVIVNLQIGSV